MSPLLHTFAQGLRHPAVRLYLALYALGIVVLWVNHGGNPLLAPIQLFLSGWELLYLAITLWLTPTPPPDSPSRGRSLPAQMAVLAALLGITLFIPQLATTLGLPYHVTNPALYVVLPAAMLILGFDVSPRGLGIRPGYRAWAVAAVWIGVQAIFVIVQMALGHFTPAWVANRLLGNVLQNGFVEEFLWRGVIQTRLALWLTPAWGAVLAALLFGLWHLRANLTMLDGDWLAALAFCVVSQARYGLMMAVLFLRTRSLLAPGLAHTFANLNPLNFL